MSSYLVGCGGASVLLSGDDDLLALFARATGGFFDLSVHSQCGGFSGWHVRANAASGPEIRFIDAQSRQIEISAPTLDRLVKHASRVVRHLLRFSLSQRGWVFCHAAMVRYRSRGIAVCGDRGAGKTTLTLGLMGLAGAEFVSNDDLALIIQDTRVMGVGWPRAIRIRQKSLNSLGENIFARGRPVELTHPEESTKQFPPIGLRHQSDVTLVEPEELAVALGADVAPSAALDVLIFPIRSTAQGPATLKILDDKALARQLLSEATAPWIPLPGSEHAPDIAQLFTPPVMNSAADTIDRAVRQAHCVMLFSDHSDGAYTVRAVAGLIAELTS